MIIGMYIHHPLNLFRLCLELFKLESLLVIWLRSSASESVQVFMEKNSNSFASHCIMVTSIFIISIVVPTCTSTSNNICCN